MLRVSPAAADLLGSLRPATATATATGPVAFAAPRYVPPDHIRLITAQVQQAQAAAQPSPTMRYLPKLVL